MYIQICKFIFLQTASLLHVSAINCGYIHLPEDDQNRWSKHVGGYAFCNKINLKNSKALFGVVSHNGLSVQGHETFKIDIIKLRIEKHISFFWKIDQN
jgi:hypothetical protein